MNYLRLLLSSGFVVGCALSVSAGAFTACSSSSSGPAPSSGGLGSFPPAGPDVDPPADIMLQPDVVIVHGGAPVLKNLSSDHGVWTLDKSASGVQDIAPGKVLLIAGLDCARVTSMQDNGSTLDVTVEPVAITDVIQAGSINWQNLAADLSKGILGQVPYTTVVANEAPSDAGAPDGSDCGAAEAGMPEAGADGGLACQALRGTGLHFEDNPPTNNPTNNVKLTIGNWTVQFGAATTTTGADISGTLTWMPGSTPPAAPGDPSSTLGGISASISFTNHVANLSGSSGSINVSGGSISNASLASSVEGSVDVNVNVSTPKGSQFPAQALLKIPVAAEFPLPGIIPGIPFYLSVQAAILIQPSLATANSVLGFTSHIAYSGNAGLTYSGGSASPSASPTAMTPDNVLNNTMAPPEIGMMAMVFAIQAPRIGFGIGTMAFGAGAKAGLYVDAVNSFGLVVAGATALVPCQSATWNFVSHGGGEMNITIGGTTVGVSHQIDLVTFHDPGTWYTPMVAACKI